MQELLKYGSVLIDPFLSAQSYSSTAVFVVGCGGTGGRLIPLVAQHICNHNNEIANNPRNKQHLKHRMQLVLVDADDVEDKNLRRQNFFKFDVGKNKSQIFAERYSAVYGMDIHYVDKYITEADHPFNAFRAENFIIFDCTDNVKARRAIEVTSIAGCTYRSIISCGNEDTFGQVLLSYVHNAGHGTSSIGRCIESLSTIKSMIDKPSVSAKNHIRYLPSLLELYRDFKDTEKPSCTEVALVDDQSMPINTMVAMFAYNVFYNLVSGSKFKYNMVKMSTNNICTTNIVTNPLAVLDLLVRGLHGECTGPARDATMKLLKLYTESNQMRNLKYDQFKAVADACGKYAIPFARVYLTQAWYLSASETADLNSWLWTRTEETTNEVNVDASVPTEVSEVSE